MKGHCIQKKDGRTQEETFVCVWDNIWDRHEEKASQNASSDFSEEVRRGVTFYEEISFASVHPPISAYRAQKE